MPQRSIGITVTSGDETAISEACIVTGLNLAAGAGGCLVHFRDGGSAGPIRWTLEAGASISIGSSFSHDAGLRFTEDVYVELVSGDLTAVNVAVQMPSVRQQ